jgi:AcrR family transcriptional regulator
MSSVQPVDPVTPKGRATRERLIEAARAVAIESGGAIEVAAVAEAAGVVPSLIHRYFGSKAGLVAATGSKRVSAPT